MSLSLALTADRRSYAPGAPIAVELRLTTREPITLEFWTAQRYDLVVEDERGTVVWRWSDGRMFAQMLGAETLPAGGEMIVRETVPAPAAPGRYRLTGTVTAALDPHPSASTTIDVA